MHLLDVLVTKLLLKWMMNETENHWPVLSFVHPGTFHGSYRWSFLLDTPRMDAGSPKVDVWIPFFWLHFSFDFFLWCSLLFSASSLSSWTTVLPFRRQRWLEGGGKRGREGGKRGKEGFPVDVSWLFDSNGTNVTMWLLLVVKPVLVSGSGTNDELNRFNPGQLECSDSFSPPAYLLERPAALTENDMFSRKRKAQPSQRSAVSVEKTPISRTPTDFICRLTFKNELPDLSFEPKFLRVPVDNAVSDSLLHRYSLSFSAFVNTQPLLWKATISMRCCPLTI